MFDKVYHDEDYEKGFGLFVVSIALYLVIVNTQSIYEQVYKQKL